MGLTIRTKDADFDCGYSTFDLIRKQVCKEWAGDKAAELYLIPSYLDDEANEKFYKALVEAKKLNSFEKTEEGKFVNFTPDGVTEHLVHFLFRSDCEGEISVKEAKVIKNFLEKIKGVPCVRYHQQTGNYKDMFLELINIAIQENTPITYN